ncbi:hypothetical protein C162_20191 [Paenibacillus sp. FSL R7-269]|uniref:SIR2 family protein n=1 Tax=Paenibacillus sp. FSL R7-269 TaxID=1226755 RepID=UPI0003E22949|nr:SIR2 family protein [Paenibacillus sp. FSL R7-269]ETT45690.1 hypothetical protein C162_20191 [Paenibacillus sp. FSL R7-269]
MSVLDELNEKNEYPIMFIGSGISRRYLEGFPGWGDLLEYFWNQLGQDREFYAYLNELRESIDAENPGMDEDDLNYYTNIHSGSEIERLFNELFYKGRIEIDSFTQKQAYQMKLSPFKKAVSDFFSRYSVKDDRLKEVETFQKALNKAQVILTTNYDCFIEDSFQKINGNGIKKFIGQKGFFEQTFDWAELYKLHGCCQEPDTITISSSDYERFEKNSILISAKIISMLIHSPIIFLGYSLTDMNIRKIIKDFSSSLNPTDITRMASRIIIVEWEQGQQDLVEHRVFDKTLNCEYTVVKTDNYDLFYSKLLEINQGVSPLEVRKFQHLIKELIIDSGRKGSLQSILIAPEDIDELLPRIGDGNLVVALGDTTYIFRMPDLITYLDDYIFERDEIPTDIALRFVANCNRSSRIPFLDLISKIENIDRTPLNPSEKERIKQRIESFDVVDNIINSVPMYYKIEFESLHNIKSKEYKEDKEMEILSYNAKRVSYTELDEYIKNKVSTIKREGIVKPSTAMRRLLMIYDFLRQNERG